jgi:predicted pyridoxine 5'-phosphate oxidase superfamily flavin-nucleotide-binding protein
MGKLTAEMKEMLGKQLTFVATADREGTVNVGPKGSTIIVDDDTLAYAESAGDKTLRNLQQNPRISVLIFDLEKRVGYQFKGNTELIQDGPLFDNVSKRQLKRNRPLPKKVVKIHITEIYQFKTGSPSTRIA